MDSSNGDSPQNLLFPAWIRRLRMRADLTQREVAERIGVKESTYANAEAAKHRRLRLERVQRIAEVHGLDAAATADLVAAWQAMPESDYNQRNGKPWAERDAKRAKLRSYEPLRRALVEMVSLVLGVSPDPDTLCSCEEPDMFADPDSDAPRRCEICNALHLLDLGAWAGAEATMEKLAKLHEKLETKMTGKDE
jgi:transcriptional regulator with XRE-family HTH domain